MVLSEEQKKEYQREYQRKYRKNNKDKVREQRREYRERNKERLREDNRKYREDNKERRNECQRKYSERNKERLREHNRKYYKEYSKTDKGIKSRTISSWKLQGLVDDFDKVYEIFEYTLFCDLCRCDLDQCTKSVKCMDHDHASGLFRNVLCNLCNIKRG